MKEIGKLAAKKFKRNPQKRQKLESLSPHWLRHLSASHQDLVGISGTMIQANHRHGSYSTTQIYLHAPDELRAESMNKMSMQINPKLYPNDNSKVKQSTQITIALTGGVLDPVKSLIRLISAIEDNIFADFTLQRIGELTEISDIIAKYEKIKIFKRPLEISYEIIEVPPKEKLDYLKTAILREAEIRLFECTIKIKY